MSTFDLRVCIIGAGPAGLCSLRHCLANSRNIQATVFEQQNDVGGLWNYQGFEAKLWDCNGNPLAFPMYNDLRCNLPKQLMEFHDFKHKSHIDTFATRQNIHDYLVEYANHFRLWPNIKLNTRIISTQPLKNGAWLVTSQDTKTHELNVYTFDAVICCTGANFYPRVPVIEGIETFLGIILHSKYFKDASDFRDKKVVCLGLGPSCADFCLKLAPVAKQVVACHRFPGGFSLGIVPKNVRETVNIKQVGERSITTENGEEIPCDVLIFCTGYRPYFPFLGIDLGKEFEQEAVDSIVYNLYKRIMIPSHPTFCFINALGQAAEFLMMEVQAKYFVSCLEGKVVLPPKSGMELAVTKDSDYSLKKRKSKLTDGLRSERFALTNVQKYLEDLCTEGGFAQEFFHIPLQLTVYQWVIQRIFGSLAVYRRDEVRVLSANTLQYTSASATPDENPGSIKLFCLMDNGTVVVKEIQI